MNRNLLDLPDEVLLEVLSYITNIREKIRLASVSSKFYDLVSEACRYQEYKLVNYRDYMYDSEINHQERDQQTPFVNLHVLLRIAPKLTHFVDKIYHFDYEKQVIDDVNYRVPLPLVHTTYIYIDLCHAYFFGRPYGTAFDQKIQVFLTNAPLVTTLDIRADGDCNFQFPIMSNLKAFKLGYFVTDRWPRLNPFPSRLLSLLNGKSPNLEEIELNSQYIDICHNLPSMMTSLAVHCPKLRSFKVTQLSAFAREHYDSYLPYDENKKLLHLEYLDLRGAVFPPSFWEKLLSLVPNLRFIAFESTTDSMIKRLLIRFCRNAKYDVERPHEIEDEFRIFNQKTYGLRKERYIIC